MMLIFVAYLNYLVDVYTLYAASAIAANTILRSAVGAAAPLFTNRSTQSPTPQIPCPSPHRAAN